MATARRRNRTSAWRTDGIVMASLWTLVAILWVSIAVAPKVFGSGLC